MRRARSKRLRSCARGLEYRRTSKGRTTRRLRHKAKLLDGDAPMECDVLVCSDDEKAKQVAMELAGKISGVRAVNGGKLENARIVESITALLIGLNIRYKVHGAGVRFTGLPGS